MEEASDAGLGQPDPAHGKARSHSLPTESASGLWTVSVLRFQRTRGRGSALNLSRVAAVQQPGADLPLRSQRGETDVHPVSRLNKGSVMMMGPR